MSAACVSDCNKDEERQILQKGDETSENGDIRIILIGKTGSGKSATANSIIGQNLFKETSSPGSVTRRGQYQRMKFDGKIFHIVDTPGLIDTDMDTDDLKTEILKSFALISPGPHIILYVLRIGRYTKESIDAEREFLQMLKEDPFRFSIVVLTGKDDIDHHKVTTTEYLDKAPTELRNLIDKCHNRVIFLNNRLPPTQFYQQWLDMYDLIKSIIKENQGLHYIDELLEKIEKEMELQTKEMIKKNQAQSAMQAREHLREDIKNEGWFLNYLKQKEVIIGILTGVIAVTAGIAGKARAMETAAVLGGAAIEKARGRCSVS